MHFIPANHSESNGLVERFHSTVAEIFRCIKPKYPDLSHKEIFLIANTLYNNTIHSATGFKPREVFYGIKDGEERPLNIELMMQEKNKFYDEIILANEKTQNSNVTYHNKGREEAPNIKENEIIYKKIQGIRNKTKEKYLPTRAAEDNGRIVTDDSGREIHKDNIKRSN